MGESALDGAMVRAFQAGTEKGVAMTNAAGDYSVFNLEPGTYDIEVSASGFPTQNLTSQSVGAGRITVLNFDMLATGVESDSDVPRHFSLSQNYPNPFNPSTTIRYELPRRSRVMLRIFNLLGQVVATLVDEEKTAGRYEWFWDARNLASGLYFYRLQAGEFAETKKLVLVK